MKTKGRHPQSLEGAQGSELQSRARLYSIRH
jgi:hypothetical protein